MEDILICKCGWWGKFGDQDALGSKCGCCPDCGNEDLKWLSDLRKRIKELKERGYIRHKNNCRMGEFNTVLTGEGCTCGLSKLLKGK